LNERNLQKAKEKHMSGNKETAARLERYAEGISDEMVFTIIQVGILI
jgi:hypothetical protein